MNSLTDIQSLFKDDAMVKLLGIEIVDARPGHAETLLKLTDEHLNSIKMTHGAVLFAMADVTMAIASNMHGKVAVAFSVTINYLKASTAGEVIKATAKEDNLTKKTGVYRIEIVNQDNTLIAVAEGTVFRKEEHS